MRKIYILNIYGISTGLCFNTSTRIDEIIDEVLDIFKNLEQKIQEDIKKFAIQNTIEKPNKHQYIKTDYLVDKEKRFKELDEYRKAISIYNASKISSNAKAIKTIRDEVVSDFVKNRLNTFNPVVCKILSKITNHYKSSNDIPTIIDNIREYKLDFISNEWKDTSKMYTTRMFSVSEQEFYEKE